MRALPSGKSLVTCEDALTGSRCLPSHLKLRNSSGLSLWHKQTLLNSYPAAHTARVTIPSSEAADHSVKGAGRGVQGLTGPLTCYTAAGSPSCYGTIHFPVWN